MIDPEHPTVISILPDRQGAAIHITELIEAAPVLAGISRLTTTSIRPSTLASPRRKALLTPGSTTTSSVETARSCTTTSSPPARSTLSAYDQLRRRASSMGRVTSFSTSSGAASGYSERTVSVGYEMSGSRFSFRRDRDTMPNSTMAPTPRYSSVPAPGSSTSDSAPVVGRAGVIGPKVVDTAPLSPGSAHSFSSSKRWALR